MLTLRTCHLVHPPCPPEQQQSNNPDFFERFALYVEEPESASLKVTIKDQNLLKVIIHPPCAETPRLATWSTLL
jgi:hypothetical protein